MFPSLPSSRSRSPLSQISLATLAFLTYTNRSEMYKLCFCLYKAWENCIYTCKYIYFRPINLLLYNKNTPLPSFFCLSLFLVLYNFQIVSNFSLSRFIQFDSIVYSLSSLFCLSLFLILYKFKLYIIVLYTYNNTIRFIHFVFIQFSAQVSFSFLFYTLRFIQFASTVYV